MSEMLQELTDVEASLMALEGRPNDSCSFTGLWLRGGKGGREKKLETTGIIGVI